MTIAQVDALMGEIYPEKPSRAQTTAESAAEIKADS